MRSAAVLSCRGVRTARCRIPSPCQDHGPAACLKEDCAAFFGDGFRVDVGVPEPFDLDYVLGLCLAANLLDDIVGAAHLSYPQGCFQLMQVFGGIFIVSLVVTHYFSSPAEDNGGLRRNSRMSRLLCSCISLSSHCARA